jgi:hypothetical protein
VRAALSGLNQSDQVIRALAKVYERPYGTYRYLTPRIVHPLWRREKLKIYDKPFMLEDLVSVPSGTIRQDLSTIKARVQALPLTATFVWVHLDHAYPALSTSSKLSLMGAYLARRFRFANIPRNFDLAEADAEDLRAARQKTCSTAWKELRLGLERRQQYDSSDETQTLNVLGEHLTVLRQHWQQPTTSVVRDEIRHPPPSHSISTPDDVHVWAVDDDLLETYGSVLPAEEYTFGGTSVVPIFSPLYVRNVLAGIKPLNHTKHTPHSRRISQQLKSRYKMHRGRDAEHLDYLIQAVRLLLQSWAQPIVPRADAAELVDADTEEPPSFDLLELAGLRIKNKKAAGAAATSEGDADRQILHGHELDQRVHDWMAAVSPPQKKPHLALSTILDLRRADAMPPVRLTHSQRRAKRKELAQAQRLMVDEKDEEEEEEDPDPVMRMRKSPGRVALKRDGVLL